VLVDDKLFNQLVALSLPYFWLKEVKRMEARLELSLSTKSINIVETNVQNLQPNRMLELECRKHILGAYGSNLIFGTATQISVICNLLTLTRNVRIGLDIGCYRLL
jgi:hypothetical protein